MLFHRLEIGRVESLLAESWPVDPNAFQVWPVESGSEYAMISGEKSPMRLRFARAALRGTSK
jgi:hypothetical protein